MLRDEVVVAPLAAFDRRLRFARHEAHAGIRLLREHLHLHTAMGIGGQFASDDEFHAIREGGGDFHFHHGRRFGREIRRIRPI